MKRFVILTLFLMGGVRLQGWAAEPLPTSDPIPGATGLRYPAAASAQAEPLLQKVPSRPNSEAGPTPVSVVMWLADIDSIDSAQQNFIVNLMLVLRWKDPRLAHGTKDLKRYSALDVWTPRPQIANEIGIVRRTMAEVVDVKGDGSATRRQRFVGPLSQPLNLRDFPFDKHLFRIHLAAVAHDLDEIQFVPDAEAMKKGLKSAVGISSEISLPDWTVEDYQARPLAYTAGPDIKIPGYAFEFIARRDSRFYVVKVITPLILIVMMSWVAFWIDPTEIGTNVNAVMTSMLTLVAYRFSVESYLPKVGYLTRMDKFMLWSTLFVFCSLVQVVINSALVSKDRLDLAKKIDRWARGIYPVIFTLITLFAFWI